MEKFVKYNKIFISLYANWASVDREFNLPVCRLAKVIDRFTILLSAVILSTSLMKFVKFQDFKQNKATDEQYMRSYPTYRDVLLLNYLPRINDFGKLYYGLVASTVGVPLVWRIYLTFYRPYMATAVNYKNCDAKRSLIQFVRNGRHCVTKDRSHIRSIATVFARCVAVLEDARYMAALSDATSQFSRSTRTYAKPKLSPLSHAHMRVSGTPSPAEQSYRNPIRVYNFLDEYSEDRWKWLTVRLYQFVALQVILSMPLLYYAITGLYVVTQNFTDYSDRFATKVLNLYGLLEHTYIILQAGLFFIATNVFITIFYLDLVQKSGPIRTEIEKLNEFYQFSDGATGLKVSQEHIHMQQLRVWAYFDNVVKLDCFVSKFSLVSMIYFCIGVSFGQSYLKVEEKSLRYGTAAAIISNFISFTFLYLISYDIEERSNKIHRLIISILARDRDFVTQRIWQKTLVAFYEKDWKRTFTLDKKFTLNLHSYFRVMFYLVTMSAIINKLFHKNSWDSSFLRHNKAV